MIESFPKIISEDEIIVRFIFKSDFKRKNVSKNNINFSNFLQPYKGGVSLQRGFYCSENEAKNRGKKIENKVYIGFFAFKKSEFSEAIKKYLLSNPSFETDIFATPLDINNEYLSLPIYSENFIIEKGNPSHADIIYLKPSPKEGETPKTAIRSFVKKFFQEKYLIIDTKADEIEFSICKFSDVV